MDIENEEGEDEEEEEEVASENSVEVDSQESYNNTENDHSPGKQKVVALKRPPPFTLKIPVNIVRILKCTEH